MLYSRVVQKYLEVLEPDIDLFAENAQQRVSDAFGHVRQRLATHVTRNAKELMGAVAQLLTDTAASAAGGGRAAAASRRVREPPEDVTEEDFDDDDDVVAAVPDASSLAAAAAADAARQINRRPR